MKKLILSADPTARRTDLHAYLCEAIPAMPIVAAIEIVGAIDAAYTILPQVKSQQTNELCMRLAEAEEKQLLQHISSQAAELRFHRELTRAKKAECNIRIFNYLIVALAIGLICVTCRGSL